MDPQLYSATLSQVTIIIHVAAKFWILGNREQILLVPCCSSEFCVVRYHSCPPLLVWMSVQKGAMILWDPLIGNGSEVYWVSGDPNVTSPLLFTYAIKKRFYQTHTNTSSAPPINSINMLSQYVLNISTVTLNNIQSLINHNTHTSKCNLVTRIYQLKYQCICITNLYYNIYIIEIKRICSID